MYVVRFFHFNCKIAAKGCVLSLLGIILPLFPLRCCVSKAGLVVKVSISLQES